MRAVNHDEYTIEYTFPRVILEGLSRTSSRRTITTTDLHHSIGFIVNLLMC